MPCAEAKMTLQTKVVSASAHGLIYLFSEFNSSPNSFTEGACKKA